MNTQLIIIHTEFNFNKGYFAVKRKEEKYKLNLVKIFEIDDVVFKLKNVKEKNLLISGIKIVIYYQKKKKKIKK